jgi:phosphatidate cytidylyltransferase
LEQHPEEKKDYNLLKRVLISVIGIPLIIFTLIEGGYFYLSFAIILQSFCLYEFINILRRKSIYPLLWVNLISSIGFILLNYFNDKNIFYYALIYFALILIVEIFRKEYRNFLNPAVSVLGIFYITIPFIFLRELLEIKDFNRGIYILVLIWTCDTFAYFGGRLFGKHKLSSISKGKTIEGSVTGLIFTVIASLIFFYFSKSNLQIPDFLITGFLIGIFSQIGDLFESLIKRFAGVKDSSDFIPGHGGFLDRFDSFLFVVPVIYFYFKFVKIYL